MLETDWDDVSAILVAPSVARTGGVLALRHRLRGLDAIHLASALTVRAAAPLMVTFDTRLAHAARREGLPVAGA
jgi:predicted nucleic acid-binding protein